MFVHQRLDMEGGSHGGERDRKSANPGTSGKARAVFQGHSHQND